MTQNKFSNNDYWPKNSLSSQDSFVFLSVFLTLKLPEEGQMALPLNLNDKNIPNADFFIEF